MFHHIVLLHLREVDADFHARVAATIKRLRQELPFVRSYDFVRNGARRAAGHDWAVISHFDTAGDFERYRDSDIHRTLEALMADHIVDLIVLDAEIPASTA